MMTMRWRIHAGDRMQLPPSIIRIAIMVLLLLAPVLTAPTAAQSGVDDEVAVTEHSEGALLRSRPFALDFGAVQDESAPPMDDADGWRIHLNSWIWAMGIEGDLGARGLTKAVDDSFFDILDASDSIIAFSGRLEIARGRFGGFVDGMYSRLGVEDVVINQPDIDLNANIDFDIDLGAGPFNPNPNPDPNPDLDLGLLPAEIDMTLELAIVDFGLMYRLGEWPMEASIATPPRTLSLDAYAGARYTLLTIEIDPARSEAVDTDRDWIDPIIGAAVALPIADTWEFRGWGDVGGFGVSSDFTWSMTGVLGYDFTLFDHPATVYGGYRAIGYEYTDGDGRDRFTWDVTLHGPIIGLSLVW
jgi:hypothetical protein